MTRIIQPVPLTAEAFAPFGDVIESRGRECFPINDGRADRFHDLARIQMIGQGARPIISVVRSRPLSLPFDIDWMERHPLGSQAFIPMQGQRYLVVVAPIGEEIRLDAVHAFATDGRQGINYHARVWHAPLLALDRESEFLVVDRGGPGDNCDVVRLEEPLRIDVRVPSGTGVHGTAGEESPA